MILFLLSACKSKIATRTSPQWSCDELLQRELMAYLNEHPYPDSKMLHITVCNAEDSSIYIINYITSPIDLLDDGMTFFVDLHDIRIAFTIYECSIIKPSETYILENIKDYFPKDYDYYKANNDYLPPPGNRFPNLVLCFHQNTFVKKFYWDAPIPPVLKDMTMYPPYEEIIKQEE